MADRLSFLFATMAGRGPASGRSDSAPIRVERQPTGAQLADNEYFQSRAEQEVAQAQSATDPAVVAVHYELAERYLERVGREEPES